MVNRVVVGCIPNIYVGSVPRTDSLFLFGKQMVSIPEQMTVWETVPTNLNYCQMKKSEYPCPIAGGEVRNSKHLLRISKLVFRALRLCRFTYLHYARDYKKKKQEDSHNTINCNCSFLNMLYCVDKDGRGGTENS